MENIYCDFCGKDNSQTLIYKLSDGYVCADCRIQDLLDTVKRQADEFIANLAITKKKFDEALKEAVSKALTSKKKVNKKALKKFTEQYSDDKDVDELLRIFEETNKEK